MFMIEYHSVGGQNRPVSFALRIAYFYEREFGRPYLQDVMRLSEALAQSSVEGGELSFPLALTADLIWAGFKTGAVVNGKVFSATPDEVAEWLLAEPGLMVNLLNQMMASFPRESGDEATPDASVAKKKKPAQKAGVK